MGEITDPALLSQLNATGDDFLKTLDPARASQVQALAEGRMDLPKGYSLRSPVGQELLADVAQYDPTFDVANVPARTATRKAFTSGKQGQNITSFNTAIGHLGTLAQAAEDLHNRSFVPWNGLANAAESAIGDPAVTKFNVAKQAVVDELERAFKGTGGNVHEIQQWENTLNSSRSPDQLRGAIKQASDLLQSRIGAMKDSYNAGMGTTDQPLPMLNAHASDALTKFQSPDYLSKGYSAVAAPSTPPGATPPDPGAGAPPAPGAHPSVTPPGSGGGGEGLITSEAPHAVPAEYEAFRQDLQDKINTGVLKTPDAVQAYALGKGFNLDPKEVQGTFDLIAKGGKASVATPVSTEAGHLGAADTFAANAGNALMLGALPKLGGVIGAAEAKLGGDQRSFGDIYDRIRDANESTLDNGMSDHPVAALGGNVAGFIGGDAALGSLVRGVAGASPALSGRIGGLIPAGARPALQDAAYGAAYGAGSSDHLADVPGAALGGGLSSAAGGALGRTVVRGLGAVASPVANAAVRRLTDAGVTLTPGQILGAGGGLGGRMVKGIEDRAAGFPVVGDIINNARRGGIEDVNRAAINDALAPIGSSLPENVPVGHAAVQHAQQEVGDAYDRALSNMSAVPDAQLTSDLRSVGRRVSTLSPSHQTQFMNIVDTDLQPYLNGRGALDGSDLQSIKQGLDKHISNLRGEGSSPQDRDLSDRLADVRDAVLDLAGRTDPASAQEFQQANRAFSLLSRVEGAAAKAKDGVFTPNQFRQAVTKRGYGTTTRNVATGTARMQQLATDASTVLPSVVPDSGTAGRGALLVAGKLATGGGGAALGGVSGYEQGGIAGALTGAALGAAAFSRPGLRATQMVLAGSRGRTLNTLGAVLRRNASIGGAVGAPLLLHDFSK